MTSEPPLEDCLNRFWFAGPEPDVADDQASRSRRPAQLEAAPRTPLERLPRPQITVRGRNLADLLQPVYEALGSGETGS